MGVGLDDDNPKDEKFGQMQYAVTASHVVTNASASEEIFLRVNTHSGTTCDIPLPKKSWIHHPDTDVAVTPIDWPNANVELDVMSFSLEHLLTKADSQKHCVSAGDEVILIGLFVKFPGTKRIQPIARFGRISLMPYDPIPIEVGTKELEVDAYLVEALAWPGMSGCPAIIYPTRAYGDRGTQMYLPFYILGLLHGLCEFGKEVKFSRDVRTVKVHSGISVVIPSDKIRELLMSDDMKAQRAELLKQRKAENNKPIATPATPSASQTSEPEQ